MSVRNSVKKIAAEFNVGLRMCRFIGRLKSNSTGATTGTSKIKNFPPLNLVLDGKPQKEKLYFIFPKLDVSIQKNIIEPEKNIKINFELPVKNSSVTELDLPLHIEKEIIEPGKVISKKAIKMIRVRRRKMRKHKRIKYRKKFSTEIFRRKLARKMEKEANFQNSVRVILNEKEKFTAEKYVEEMLEKYHWKRPITRVRGFLAPQWVIKQHLEKEEEKRILKERIKKCSE